MSKRGLLVVEGATLCQAVLFLWASWLYPPVMVLTIPGLFLIALFVRDLETERRR
jgi:hypothetical protein